MGSIYSGLKAQAGKCRLITGSGTVQLFPHLVMGTVTAKDRMGQDFLTPYSSSLQQKGHCTRRSAQGRDSYFNFHLWSHKTQQRALQVLSQPWPESNNTQGQLNLPIPQGLLILEDGVVLQRVFLFCLGSKAKLFQLRCQSKMPTPGKFRLLGLSHGVQHKLLCLKDHDFCI